MIIDLTKLKSGQHGKVVGIEAGYCAAERITNMGIIPGKNIKKISSSFFRGPQTVQVGTAQIAIGYGMAKKVIVEILK